MSVQAKPLNVITEQALDVLAQELGVVDMVRFLNQYTTGSGNYTVDRRKIYDDMPLEEIVADIRAMKTKAHS